MLGGLPSEESSVSLNFFFTTPCHSTYTLHNYKHFITFTAAQDLTAHLSPILLLPNVTVANSEVMKQFSRVCTKSKVSDTYRVFQKLPFKFFRSHLSLQLQETSETSESTVPSVQRIYLCFSRCYLFQRMFLDTLVMSQCKHVSHMLI